MPAPPPYVLSWLKLAKSRWPLPASPLCPAKFMAGQPSATPVRRGDASSRQSSSSPAAPVRSTRPRPPHRRQRLVYAAGGGEAPRRRRPAPAPWLRMRSSAPPALAATVLPPRVRPPPGVGGAARALWWWRRTRLGEGGGGGVVKLSGEREGGRRGGGRAPVEAAVLPRSRGCRRAAGCGRRCPSPAVLLRAAGGPQGSAVGRRRGRALRGGGGGWRPNRVTRGPPAPCPSVLLPPHSGCPYGRRAAEPPGNCCSAAIVRLGVRLLPSHMGCCLHMWVIATNRAAIHTRPGGVPTCGTLPVWGLTCLWGGFVAKNRCVWDTPVSQKPSS